jgi:glycosyl transferase, family 25
MRKMAFNQFDGVLYINLLHRRDRRMALENELERVGVDSNKVYRVKGVYDELNGCRGCVSSHIKALDEALARGWKNVLILEDDCCFVEDREKIDRYIEDFFHTFGQIWDVFLLGGELKCTRKLSHSFYLQVLFSFRSHAYVVNGPYMKRLRDHFAATLASMQQDLFYVTCLEKALDRQWVVLQCADRWYAGKELIAEQRISYSDIEKDVKERR